MYYVGKNGQQTGPYNLDQVRSMYASGEILPSDLVWKEGTADWKPASTFDEIAPAPAPAPASPVSLNKPGLPAAPTPSYVPQVGAPGSYGGAQPVMSPGAQVPNYLVFAIITTLCCCLPFGIPAIVFASQVNTKLAAGDYAGALDSSRKAKMWCWIAFGLGLLGMLLYAGLYGTAIAAAIAEEASRQQGQSL